MVGHRAQENANLCCGCGHVGNALACPSDVTFKPRITRAFILVQVSRSVHIGNILQPS
jgi:hypothetical protein